MSAMQPLLPSVNITVPEPNCCQQITCCSQDVQGNIDNSRMVYTSGQLAPEKPESRLRRVLGFGCCRPKSLDELQNENIAAIAAFKRSLEQKFGPLVATIANNFHLKPKIYKREPLYMKDIAAIEEVAKRVKDQDLGSLNQFFEELRLCGMYNSAVSQNTDEPEPKEKLPVFLSVNDQKTPLDVDKIKEKILGMKTMTPICPELCAKISDQVLARLCKDQTKEVVITKDSLNRLIVSELKRNGISLISSVAQHMNRKALIDSLLNKSRLDELSELEFCELYAAMKNIGNKTKEIKIDVKQDV